MNLKTQTNDVAKFERAAKLADVSIVERSDFANGTSVVVLKFKRPDQLINLGMYFGLEEAKKEAVKVEPEEVKVQPQTKVEPKAESKKEEKK